MVAGGLGDPRPGAPGAVYTVLYHSSDLVRAVSLYCRAEVGLSFEIGRNSYLSGDISCYKVPIFEIFSTPSPRGSGALRSSSDGFKISSAKYLFLRLFPTQIENFARPQSHSGAKTTNFRATDAPHFGCVVTVIGGPIQYTNV